MPNTVKIPAEKWIDAARDGLISEGLAGVKIDRLAKRLGVTRGGFYHHFDNYDDLVKQLIQLWANSNDFLPDVKEVASPDDAADALDAIVARLIAESDFSPAYELAMREWARIDAKARRTVDKVDKHRIERLTEVFLALGCDSEEAGIRARVFYFHQIGFYSLGYHKRQSTEERMRNAPIYLRILCGRRYSEAVERRAKKWS